MVTAEHMLARACYALLLTLALSSCAAGVAHQSSGEPDGTSATPRPPQRMPLLPLVAEYQSWDRHFIQWLPEKSPFETLEVLVQDSRRRPKLWVFLTHRESSGGSKHQVHYVNDTQLSDTLGLSAGDREVHVAEIHYHYAENSDGATMQLALETVGGPLSWSFHAAQLPDPTRSRLINSAEAAHDLRGGLLLFYLEATTLSSSSSFVKLGSEEYRAIPWPERSRPPYFQAFKGAYGRSAHLGYFPALSRVRAKVSSQGSVGHQYRETHQWQLMSMSEEQRTFSVTTQGDRIAYVSDELEQAVVHTQDSWAIQSAAVKSQTGAMLIEFEPPLPDVYEMGNGTKRAQFRVSMPGAPRLMTGSLTLSKSGNRVASQFRPQSPLWATTLEVNTILELHGYGYTYEAATAFPTK